MIVCGGGLGGIRGIGSRLREWELIVWGLGLGGIRGLGVL